jgi:hypothetical protein
VTFVAFKQQPTCYNTATIAQLKVFTTKPHFIENFITTRVSNYTFFRYSGHTIDLSLAGKRALEFDGETVLQVGQQSHVIAIFVGTLMKVYQGDHGFLSGTSACRWYINHNDIPEIKAFQKR